MSSRREAPGPLDYESTTRSPPLHPTPRRTIAAACSFAFSAISLIFEVIAVWVVIQMRKSGPIDGGLAAIAIAEWFGSLFLAAVCAGIGLVFAYRAKNRTAKLLAFIALLIVFLWIAYIVLGLVGAIGRTGQIQPPN